MCVHVLSVLDKLIILSKFVTEKEKKKKKKKQNKKKQKQNTLTLQQNNCICCFIKFLCYYDSSENDSMRI